VLAALGRFAIRPIVDTVAVLAVPYVAAKARVLEGSRGLRLTVSVALRQVYFTAVEPLPVFGFIAVVVSTVLLVIASALMEPEHLAPLLPKLMAPAIVREVLPLLLGLVLVARSGTAVVSEIGTLRVTHELDALECAGINVDAFVVAPRILGLMVAGSALMVLTGMAGIVGGALIASNVLLDALTPAALGVTALKGASFGFLVAIIACRHGLAVSSSAREIPVAGARATLQATLACFVVDALYTLGSVTS
jgi:phospholipid/cholesterol/gamma-HCH transport system permease protein